MRTFGARLVGLAAQAGQLSPHWAVAVLVLSVLAAVAGLAILQPFSGAKADSGSAGYDLLETDEDNTYLDVLLPADFFGPGSDPFDGRVYFRGEHIPDYQIPAGPFPGGSVVLAVSLSIRPIRGGGALEDRCSRARACRLPHPNSFYLKSMEERRIRVGEVGTRPRGVG